jgi:predicted nucleotidyltransferase
MFDIQRSADPLAVPPRLVETLVKSARLEFGEGLVAVVLVGSRVRNTWRPSSDLDIHIVHAGAWSQKRYFDKNTSEYAIPLEINVDPLFALYSWVSDLSRRAYAEFFSTGLLAYPDTIPPELRIVVDAARRTLDAPPSMFSGSERHHFEYLRLMRISDGLVAYDQYDFQSSLNSLLSSVAVLRLYLLGERHIRYHALVNQLEEVDPPFFERYRACLNEADHMATLSRTIALLQELKPRCDSWTSEAVDFNTNH